jgi:hypothetical protein
MAEIINIQPVNPLTFEFQEYSSNDLNLISTQETEVTFDPSIDYIEYYVYDLSGSILVSNIYGFPGYKLINNQVSIDPVGDLASFGYEQGSYNTLYNFLKRKLGSNPLSTYYIDEISADRTEIRLNTTEILNEDVVFLTNEFITEIQDSQFDYIDFYLNFGDNQLIIANNILLDNTNPNDPTILIKLYEPLPPQFTLKNPCWVVEQIANPIAYNISITPTFDIIDDNIYLKGPNFNLDALDKINNSTNYSNYQTLSSTNSSLSQGTGSLNYQLNNILAQTGITVNIDYSDYSNFIHFSSAQTRLENFYYKLQLLENYSYSASLSSNSSSGSYYVSSSNIIWQAKINEIITGFDSYEYYLYYSSGSTAWPKTNSAPPYINVSTTSVTGLNWLSGQLLVAEEYDIENNNALTLAIPSYIIEDEQNTDFELFVEMIGQMFDNIFIYLQNITTKFDADNRLTYGVSKDLVADILRDMGINIYQNNFSSNDVYQALIGITPSGSLYNLPFTTTQLPVPSGSFLDYITTYVTASSTSSLAPTDDINKEQYKRIYHNLPLLLKKKGSVTGLRDLITTYGIPDTILRINEFGGKDKNSNSYDNWEDTYNYGFYTSGSAFITSSFELNDAWNATGVVPQAIEFRFKTDGLPYNTASIATQSLWSTDYEMTLTLKYTGSGYTSGSYSGSTVDPYYQYATLEYFPDPSNSPTSSATIYLPFYDGGWWSVLLNRNAYGDFTLYAKNKNYEGFDGNTIGFQASSSVITPDESWENIAVSTFGSASYKIFTGSFQEIRYYATTISESTFDAYVMNPYSTEQSEYLIFRAPLGGELYTESVSVHPRVTGSWTPIPSFDSDNSDFYISSGGEFVPNTEVFYFDQVPAGIQNAVSQKIKQQNIVLPYSTSLSNIPDSNVLSPFISVQQFPSISSSYTRDIDYVEVGFSPQNEINEDINSQIGYFNIGEVIGDPRFQSSSLDTYPALDAIRYSYFEKYTSNYNYVDYIRLIKFFDNSLFKMLQDFTPARTSLASGIIIKNTLLDRNRYRVPQVNTSESIANIGSGSVNIPYVVEDQTITGSIDVGTISGGSGGSMPDLFGQTQSFDRFVNITQSWSGTTPSLSGSVSFTDYSQTEFYDGEFSGSAILVEDGDLNDCNVEIVQVGTYLDGTYINVGDNSIQPILYDFNADFTYYLSFQYQLANSTSITLKDNIGTVYFTDSNSTGVTVVRNVYQLEVNNPIIKLGWIKTGAGSVGAGYVTIFESYIEPDCLVTANDVQIDRPSSKYMDVDFNSSQIQAVNQQVILSGSATKATVPDSNYSPETGWANARYYGSDYTGQYNYSQSFASSSFPTGYPIDNFANYFMYFDWIGPSDPEYPGGGVVHGIYLIDIEGNAIPLTINNYNLFITENTFVGGQTAYILPAVYSAGKTSVTVNIVDGGAYYQTIFAKTGSEGNFTTYWSNSTSSPIYVPRFHSQSISTFNDTGSDIGYKPWLYSLLTLNDPTSGSINYYGFNFLNVYNPNTTETIVTDSYVLPTDTLFPLQNYDFIRIADTGSSPTSSLDDTFYALGLYQIKEIYTGSTVPIQTSSLSIVPLMNDTTAVATATGGNPDYQRFRVFRRIPSEISVTIQNIQSYKDPGFLIPFNFNPKYNVYDLAKKAGIIQ